MDARVEGVKTDGKWQGEGRSSAGKRDLVHAEREWHLVRVHVLVTATIIRFRQVDARKQLLHIIIVL